MPKSTGTLTAATALNHINLNATLIPAKTRRRLGCAGNSAGFSLSVLEHQGPDLLKQKCRTFPRIVGCQLGTDVALQQMLRLFQIALLMDVSIGALERIF